MLELWQRRIEVVIDLAQIRVSHGNDLGLRYADDRFLGDVQLVIDLADEFLDHVLERDETVGTTVLVHHDRDVDAAILEFAQQSREGQ